MRVFLCHAGSAAHSTLCLKLAGEEKYNRFAAHRRRDVAAQCFGSFAAKNKAARRLGRRRLPACPPCKSVIARCSAAA